MRKLLSAFIVCALATVSSVTDTDAAEPVASKDHFMNLSGYSWRLDRHEAAQTLSVSKDSHPGAVAKFDVPGCMFCAGEGDNCESDGIVNVGLGAKPREPVIAVICHIGAHSQRVAIYAPWRDRRGHVFAITGAYYVNYEITAAGISGEADEFDDKGNPVKRKFSWP